MALCFGVLSRHLLVIVDSVVSLSGTGRTELLSNRSQPFCFCAIGLLSDLRCSTLCYSTTLYEDAELASTVSAFMVSHVSVCSFTSHSTNLLNDASDGTLRIENVF